VSFPAVSTSGARSSRASACPATRRRLDALLSSNAARSSCSRATARVVKMWPARCRGARRSCLGFKTSGGTAVLLSTTAAATGRSAWRARFLCSHLLLLFLVPSLAAWVDVLGNRDGASGGCWVRGEGKGLQAFDSDYIGDRDWL
jgi:hypothetical protein